MPGPTMRVSTTTLEAYRRFMDPDQEWMTEADLEATIRGTTVATPAMTLGTAFQAVLEHPRQYQTDGGYLFEPRGQSRPDAGDLYPDWFFSDEVMTPALALFEPRCGVWEVKATKTYGRCTVVAVADVLVGATVVENKTTLGQFDFDKYAQGAQWRFYCDIFAAAQVTFNVFALSERVDRSLVLKDIHTFDLFPYAELTADCADLVERFVGYVEQRGLVQALEEKQRRSELRAGAHA